MYFKSIIRLAGIILGILITDDILELFGNNGRIIANDARIMKLTCVYLFIYYYYYYWVCQRQGAQKARKPIGVHPNYKNTKQQNTTNK